MAGGASKGSLGINRYEILGIASRFKRLTVCVGRL